MRITYLISVAILVLGQLSCIAQVKLISKERIQLASLFESQSYTLDSVAKWKEVDTLSGEYIIIENSLPKGNRYVDPGGKLFTYTIFWTRIINETASLIELSVNFPADSLALLPFSNSYVKFFLPSDSMALNKEPLYDYGATGLTAFLDHGLTKPSMLQRRISPEEEYLFYTAVLAYEGRGTVRTGMILKDGRLFYKISIIPYVESFLLPCGSILLKE